MSFLVPVPTFIGASSYNKGYTLLNTVPDLGFPSDIYARSFDNGIVHISGTSATPGFYTVQYLYTFSTSNTPLSGSLGNALCIGLVGETTTPPGYGVYQSYPSGGQWNRWNADNLTTEYITTGLPAGGTTQVVWCNQEQALFGTYYNGTRTELSKYSTLNWATHTMTTDNLTYRTAGYDLNIMQNGALIDGRIYVQATSTGQFGWVNALTGTYTQVADYTNSPVKGIVCAATYSGASPFIVTQNADTGSANVVDVWNNAGTRIAQITLTAESTTGYGMLSSFSHDRVNNYVWCRCSGVNKLYVLDMNTYTIRDSYTSGELPHTNTTPIGPVGAIGGGIYAIGGTNFNFIYKFG